MSATTTPATVQTDVKPPQQQPPQQPQTPAAQPAAPAPEQDINKLVWSSGIRVGKKVKTTFMKPFIENTTTDGLYMIDVNIIQSRIKTAARFINRIGVENIIVCSSKQHASTPIEKFADAIGAKCFTKRFMPGTLTNPSLSFYIEPKLVFVCDPQIDGQAVTEATNAGIPVIGIANTDNITSNIDLVIPANNVGRRSLATVYWLLAREILLDQKGESAEGEPPLPSIEDFESKLTEEDAEQ